MDACICGCARCADGGLGLCRQAIVAAAAGGGRACDSAGSRASQVGSAIGESLYRGAGGFTG